MKNRAERVQRLRGKGMDITKLERAEETLRGIGDTELPPEWVDATVTSVTHKTSRRRLIRGMALAAAVLLLTVLTASTKILWNGRNSTGTLSYTNAVKILRGAVPDERHIQAAMSVVLSRIEFVASVFQQLSDDPATPSAVRAATEHELTRLTALVQGVGDHPSGLTGEAFEEVGRDATSSSLNEQQRVTAVGTLGTWSATGAAGIWSIPDPTPAVMRDRRIATKHLLRQLADPSRR